MIDEVGKRQGLGRGLSALLGEDVVDYATGDVARGRKDVPVERLRPGRHQPRRKFDDEEAAALANSVREHGVLQPIIGDRCRRTALAGGPGGATSPSARGHQGTVGYQRA